MGGPRILPQLLEESPTGTKTQTERCKGWGGLGGSRGHLKPHSVEPERDRVKVSGEVPAFRGVKDMQVIRKS